MSIVNINKQAKLSEHFTLGELCKTSVKPADGNIGCAADIRAYGMEQLLRYAVILLDISDESKEDFDELLLERSAKGTYWLHFAVRPPGKNRRKKSLIHK